MLFERCYSKNSRAKLKNTFISGVRFSWTTLYRGNQISNSPVNVVLGHLADALSADVEEAEVAAAPPGQRVAVPVALRGAQED